MEQKILDSKYFKVRSDIYIERGIMNLLTLFFGLLGVPNFITKRYLQGVIHLILFFLMVLGILIFGGYFAGMPWGPILVTVSYVLAFFETKAYNKQVNEIERYSVNSARAEIHQSRINEDRGNRVVAEKADKSFFASGYTSIALSFLIILFGLLGVWSSIGSLSKGSHELVLGGLLLLFTGAVIISLFIGVWRCQRKMLQLKTELLRFGKFTKKHKRLLNLVSIFFVCGITIIIIIAFLFCCICIA